MRVKINEKETISITAHTGKMELIPSISTDKLKNKKCRALMESANPDCICKYCYVDKVFDRYKDLEPALINNTDILTTRLLSKSEIKAISTYFSNTTIVRFESFGDLNNLIQLENYVNIAKAAKYTKFGLFTKHYSIVKAYFKSGKKFPSNITLVLSSPFIDYELNTMLVNSFKKYHTKTITFTVTRDKTNPGINCGKRKCIECRNCYDSRNPKNVIELLK